MPAWEPRRTPASTMEQGVDGILMNTALAEAQDPVAMATAMRLAVEADATPSSRAACPAGRWPMPSTPHSGMLE